MKFRVFCALLTGGVVMPGAMGQVPVGAGGPQVSGKPTIPTVRPGQLPGGVPGTKGAALSPEEVAKQQKRLKNRKLTDEFWQRH